MAIFRRDRSFSKIMNEVDVESIPVHFIKRLKLYLTDSTIVTIEKDDLQKVDSIEELLIQCNFVHQVMDMSIELDYDGIEEDVTDQVTKLLNYKEPDNDS